MAFIKSSAGDDELPKTILLSLRIFKSPTAEDEVRITLDEPL